MSATLAAGRFALRPFRDDDADEFARAVAESAASIGRWMDWAHAAYTRDESLSWFALCRSQFATGSAHEYAIVDAADGAFVGGAGVNQVNTMHGVANVGYWVRESRRREGAARAAVDALAGFAFGELNLTRLEIVVAQGNAPSEAVARRAGGMHECVARNRLRIGGRPVPAHVFSLVP